MDKKEFIKRYLLLYCNEAKLGYRVSERVAGCLSNANDYWNELDRQMKKENTNESDEP